MEGRSIHVRTAAAWATVAAVILTLGSGRPAANATASVPLHVLLTLSSNLSPMTRQALVSEAERIWRHEQVSIEWARSGSTGERQDALRVLVITRPQAPRVSRKWPVAELFLDAETQAFAIASIDSAARVVDEAAQSAELDTHTPWDHRLGLVLGRAVAHEIGHFLLATGTHAKSGLMRASIDAREFAAVGGETFRLDRDASAWLRRHLATQGAAVTRPGAARFSYGRPAADDSSAIKDALLQLNPSR